MVNYIQKSDASDISPSWPNTTQFDTEMSEGTGGTGGTAISLTSSEIKSASFITVANKPNSDAFENGGTEIVEIEIIDTAMNIRARCRMVRVSATGTVLGTKGNFTAFQTLQSSRTFAPESPTWDGTELCTDRLAVEFEFENLDTMMTTTATIGTGTSVNEVITTISENNGSCTAPAGAGFSQAVIVG